MNNIKVKIADRLIGEGEPCFIIAEAGVNHNGDINLAKKLIDVAVQAGADAVKFQTFKTERLIRKETAKAEYQLLRTNPKETQYHMLKKLELTYNQHKILFRYCKTKKIMFLSTPYDNESLELLEEFDLSAYKIASTDITNLPFLKEVALKKKPIILSTGMSYLYEVKAAVNAIMGIQKETILLHCTSNYPASFEGANLLAMRTLKDIFKTIVGYSDHTPRIGIAPLAVAMGASVIEKHFTIDRNLPGPDHYASLDKEELPVFIKIIKQVEKALGTGIKAPVIEEMASKPLLQKSIISSRKIKEGDKITPQCIVYKRPASGISPIYYQKVLGKKARHDIDKDTILDWSMLV